MVCPKCNNEVSNVPIIRGSKVIGMNIFCMNMRCDFEIDKRLRRVNKNG